MDNCNKRLEWDGVREKLGSPPSSPGTVRRGKQQIPRPRDGVWGWVCFSGRNSASFVPQEIEKNTINHPHSPRACPAELDTQVASSSAGFLLPFPGSSPGSAVSRGRAGTKERGAVRGGGTRNPRTPGLPHYCPLAGSAAAATAGDGAAESRRD